MKFRNPNGPVDIPDLGLVDVAAGGVVEATGEVAASLEAQGWPRVDRPKKPSKKPAESGQNDNPDKES